MRFVEWIQANGDNVVLLVFLGGFAAMAGLEQLRPRRTGPMRRRERWPANLGLTAINFVVLGLLPISLISAARWAEGEQLGLLHQGALPAGAIVLVTLLARAFISFFTHFLMHFVPLFWRLHRVHHLDTELDVTTTVRFHPLELLVTLPIALPIVVLLGLEPWVLMVYEVLDAGANLWSHANLRLPGWLNGALRFVIVTPELHRIHHSSWRPETNSNFGAVFPIWDLLLGTYRGVPREAPERMELGLEGIRGPATQQLRWLLTSPLQEKLVDSSEAPSMFERAGNLRN